MKNAKFYKRKLNSDCWFSCGARAVGILVYVNGDEIPTCRACGYRHIKTTRIRKKADNNEGKNKEIGIPEVRQ